ncbi:hypothetical protein GCM10010446_25280 [Streptomyces enissocaesilis]|uniref:Uncharacterized protein n=1 Tax=Streptomyces enissocaesilis TaxID=332589 RepID=A0ABP6JMW3_9ACTN
MEDFVAQDIAAMRKEGDLPALMRLRIRPARAPVHVVALWQRPPGPTRSHSRCLPLRHTAGGRASAGPGRSGPPRPPPLPGTRTPLRGRPLPLPAVRRSPGNGRVTRWHGAPRQDLGFWPTSFRDSDRR